MSGTSTPAYPLRIVRGQTMAEVDHASIHERGIPGSVLMERAGTGIVQHLFSRWSPEELYKSAIICGKGNNGGDGLVIARHLFLEGLNPSVMLLAAADELRGDAKTNLERLRALDVPIHFCISDADVEAFFQTHVHAPRWIDAMLGTGTTGAPRGLIATAIRKLNRIAVPEQVVAVDIASGVDANTGAVPGEAVRAGWTITMGLPKVGHALPPGLDYGGTVSVLDIGFPQDVMNEAESEAEWLSAPMIEKLLPRRTLSDHKGTHGHLLVIAGSRGMTGAALLCAKASIAMGAGLLTALCPESQHPIYANGVWEMMTVPVNETDSGGFDASVSEWIHEHGSRFDAIAIGPGLGTHASTQELVRWVILNCTQPLVIDGDALNALGEADLHNRTHPWVATPHPGEMARLLETTTRDIQVNRWTSARRLSARDGAVVLKGPRSVIAAGDSLFVNSTGNPAMASGGMGDTLTGMIGALLAQGLSPADAARCGAYVHGLSADLLVQNTGAEALAASQVIDGIPAALRAIRTSRQRAVQQEAVAVDVPQDMQVTQPG